MKECIWLKPEAVACIDFPEWDGRLGEGSTLHGLSAFTAAASFDRPSAVRTTSLDDSLLQIPDAVGYNFFSAKDHGSWTRSVL
jgi:hypothetical protein